MSNHDKSRGNLSLTLNKGGSLYIGDSVVTLTNVGSGRAKVTINARKNVPVDSESVRKKKLATDAALIKEFRNVN